MVLAVDDLQWCDPGSLRALGFLLRRLEGLPVLIAATLRTGEQHPDEELIAELAEDLATVVVHPGPLDAAATSYLVRERLGADAHDTFVAACHRTTGGNPLLLRQLLRALQVEGVRPDASHADTVNAIGSRAVSSMVLMRLGRLPADCTAVARAIAVLGDGCELVDVATLTGLDERAGRPARSRRWPGSRCCARTTRSASCTRWSGTRCTRPCPVASASSRTSGPPPS